MNVKDPMSSHSLRGLIRPVSLAAFLGVVCFSGPLPGYADDIRVGATFDPDRYVAYPISPVVVDVTKAPYGAKGDGTTTTPLRFSGRCWM